MRDGCPFCDYAGPSPVVWRHEGVFVIEPINPVAPGHILVVPDVHVGDFSVSAPVAAGVMAAASLYARERRIGPCNVITSKGWEATQSVFHFHVHVVPRRFNDGIKLPWSGDPGG